MEWFAARSECDDLGFASQMSGDPAVLLDLEPGNEMFAIES